MSGLLPRTGRARCLGDDLTTEAILSRRRRRETSDPVQLRRYLFEDHDAGLAATLHEGDILVAGRRFGGGSVNELAIAAMLCAGIRAVVARSFARGYLRNALNNGLLALSAATEGIREGDGLSLQDADDGSVEILTPRGRRRCEPLPPLLRAMLEAGGMVPYLREHGSFGPKLPGERF